MPSETDSVPTPSDEPWHSYFRASNVWDTMPGINQYVRAVKDSQERISRQPQFDFDTMKTAEEEQEGDDDQKFASLVLTDFPSEIERPSLPVTPVPIHRPAFWSDEREASIELPSAEGVPSQAEWVCLCPRCGFSSRLESFRPRARRLVRSVVISPAASSAQACVTSVAMAETAKCTDEFPFLVNLVLHEID